MEGGKVGIKYCETSYELETEYIPYSIDCAPSSGTTRHFIQRVERDMIKVDYYPYEYEYELAHRSTSVGLIVNRKPGIHLQWNLQAYPRYEDLGNYHTIEEAFETFQAHQKMFGDID